MRPPLIFDNDQIREDRRAEWATKVKEHANFFKHANRDHDADIRFTPALAEYFILFTIYALSVCGEECGLEGAAMINWQMFHQPDLVDPKLVERVHNKLGIDGVALMLGTERHEFFEAFQLSWKNSGRT